VSGYFFSAMYDSTANKEHQVKAFHLLTFVYFVSFVFEDLFAVDSCIILADLVGAFYMIFNPALYNDLKVKYRNLSAGFPALNSILFFQ